MSRWIHINAKSGVSERDDGDLLFSSREIIINIDQIVALSLSSQNVEHKGSCFNLSATYSLVTPNKTYSISESVFNALKKILEEDKSIELSLDSDDDFKFM